MGYSNMRGVRRGGLYDFGATPETAQPVVDPQAGVPMREMPLPSAPADELPMAGAMDAGQGTNAWAPMRMQGGAANAATEDMRRRLRARGIGGGGGGGFGAHRNAIDPGVEMNPSIGWATLQTRTPSLSEQTRSALTTSAASRPASSTSAKLPVVGETLPTGQVLQSPMPTREPTYAPPPKSPSQMGSTSPIPAPAPAPAPSPIAPAPLNPTIRPENETTRTGIRLKNGGRMRKLGLGKDVGVTRGKRNPVTFDAKGNVLMADGGRTSVTLSPQEYAQLLAANNMTPQKQQYAGWWGQYMPNGWANGEDIFGTEGLVGRDKIERNANPDNVADWNGIGEFVGEDGQKYIQAAWLPRDKRFLNQNPDQFRYDPRYGLATRADNIYMPESALDKYMPAIVGTALGGAALMHAGAIGAGAGNSGYMDAIGNAAEGANAGAPLTGPVTAGAGSNGPPDSYWNSSAGNSHIGSDVIPEDVYGAGSDFPMGDMGGPTADIPVSQPAVTGDASFGIEGGGSAGAGAGAGAGGGSSGGNMLSRAADWARSNPTSAVRLATGVAGAFSGGGGGSTPMVDVGGGTQVTVPAGGNPNVRGGEELSAVPAEVDAGDDPMTFLQSVGGGGGGFSASSSGGLQSVPQSDYIRKLLEEAEKTGSAEAQETAAGRAGADVAQRFAHEREARKSRLVARGIDPNDPRGAAAEATRLAALDEAKVGAGAKNIARSTEKEKGFSRRAAAAGLALQDDEARGRAQLAQMQMSEASGRQASAERQAEMALRARLAESAADRAYRARETAADRAFRSGESATDRQWRTGESAADRNLRAQQINAGISQQNQANSNARARGIGQAVGAISSIPWGSVWDTVSGWAAKDGGRASVRKHGIYCADGGRTQDPDAPNRGGEPVDTIPAMLTDNEFVVNPEAVELLDKLSPGFLENVNERGLKLRRIRQRGLGSQA